MPYLLNLVYLLLLVAAAPLLAWRAVRLGKYRQGLSARCWGAAPRVAGAAPRVWWHAVSVGEVNQLAPVLAEYRRQFPDWQHAISTTTATGYELARKKYADLPVFYSPLDFTWATRRAMAQVRPDLLVLTELELWPNLIDAARRHGARVAIINGRLSERSFRGYRRVRPLVARVLRHIDLIAAQNEEYAERFLQLGAPAVRLYRTGSIKFDGARTDRANPQTQALAELAGITPDDRVFLAGSTQAPEEEIALRVFAELTAIYPRLRMVLVPRHPERFDEVARLLDANGLTWQRRTRLMPGSSPGAAARILLVDAIGELAAWWGTAHIAFVGGSLGQRGGQNMIEPAGYGAAVCFGPNTRNFRDIVAQLLAADAARVVQDERQLAAFVRRALDDPSWATALGQRAQRFVVAQAGATRSTVDLLGQLFPAGAAAKPRRAA
ncbi:MAG: 3-deoxy-D-manno-octulosonic acid transferase [Pirellulales bacterium]|nr:3-deoxy-D-manno-octulosonic acid transferase [Pirellulales bacterium]